MGRNRTHVLCDRGFLNFGWFFLGNLERQTNRPTNQETDSKAHKEVTLYNKFLVISVTITMIKNKTYIYPFNDFSAPPQYKLCIFSFCSYFSQIFFSMEFHLRFFKSAFGQYSDFYECIRVAKSTCAQCAQSRQVFTRKNKNDNPPKKLRLSGIEGRYGYRNSQAS